MTMAKDQVTIVGDSFALGYRFQRYWTASMASAFFFGELGAGLFIVSMVYDVVPGMIGGLIATGLLKPYFHLSHMGVPTNSWRAIMRPDRAWISRGMISIGVFVVFGLLHVVLQSGGIWGLDNASLGGESAVLPRMISVVAVLAALGVMLYHGFAISHSTAISLWSTGLMPIIGCSYSFLGGTVLTRVLVQDRDAAQSGLSLDSLSLLLLAVNALIIFILAYAALNGAPGARVSMNLLLRGRFAKLFVPLVIGVGLVVPLILLVWGPATSVSGLAAAACVLVGYYAFRSYIFKAGVYDPIMSFAPG